MDLLPPLPSSSLLLLLWTLLQWLPLQADTGDWAPSGAGDKFKYLRQPSTIHNLQSTSRLIGVSRVPWGLTMQCMQCVP